MGYGLALLVVALTRQDNQAVSNSDIDAVIRHLATDPKEIDYLKAIAWKNMPRVVWNYKRSNGCVRSRILAAVHGDAGSFSDLLPISAKDKPEDLRVMTATILARITVGPDVTKRNPLLFSMRKDPSMIVRAIVAKGLRWGFPDYKHTLDVMMRDRIPQVRLQAALSLAYNHQPDSIPVLAEFVGKSHLYSVPVMMGGEDGAEQALGRFGAAIIPYVEPKLWAKSNIVKISAIHILKVVKAPKIMDYGQRFIHSNDPMVRIAGYQAIGWERKPEAIPILLKGLEDHDTRKKPFVDSNVEAVLEGQFGPWPLKEWPEGVAALKKWKEEHPEKPI